MKRLLLLQMWELGVTFVEKFNKKENEYERNPCIGCGQRQKIFQGKDTTKEFCDWLIDEKNMNSTVIAHNGRAYDAYFIYDYLMT